MIEKYRGDASTLASSKNTFFNARAKSTLSTSDWNKKHRFPQTDSPAVEKLARNKSSIEEPKVLVSSEKVPHYKNTSLSKPYQKF